MSDFARRMMFTWTAFLLGSAMLVYSIGWLGLGGTVLLIWAHYFEKH